LHDKVSRTIVPPAIAAHAGIGSGLGFRLLKTVVDFFRRGDVRSRLKRSRPLADAALYLFLLGFASFRILQSAADGYIRNPKYGGPALPSEPAYWIFGALYLAMMLLGIWGLADVWRKMKKNRHTKADAIDPRG
jgi:protein-S-isoprenylcysteine O-methyltransferase Ste14